MKNQVLKYFLFSAFSLLAFSATAQETQSDMAASNSKYDTLLLQVRGVCGMCKSRIELAVYDMKGVKSADWDKNSETLTTVVKHGKVTREEIADVLASKGHTSELKKATTESYQELPACCRYDDGVKKHGVDRKQ